MILKLRIHDEVEGGEMPVAFLKEIYSSKLVLKDVASGSQNATESFYPDFTSEARYTFSQPKV